jgi:hypothetical protein
MLQFLLNAQRLSLGLKAVRGLSLQTSMGCDGLVYYLDGYELVADRGYSKSSIRLSQTEKVPVAICVYNKSYSILICALFDDGTMSHDITRIALVEDINKFLC